MALTRIKSYHNWQNSGHLAFVNPSTWETLWTSHPLYFYDDFEGADVVIPAAGAVESGTKWAKKIVGAAPPTLGQAADTVNGEIECALTNNDQKQDAGLYMNDELNFSIRQGLVFECRAAASVVGTGNAVMYIGMHGAWADGGSNYRVQFTTTAGGGVLNCNIDDNATDNSAAAGVTLSAGVYHIFRIDCSDYADIKFFIDGVRVASSTTFNWAASASNSKVQVYCGCYKASGEGVGTLDVDYVKVWQNRA